MLYLCSRNKTQCINLKFTIMETRGRGTSATKFCKDGSPKHAGNWSESTLHYQSLVSKDYFVKRHTIPMEDCLKETLIVVGDHENRPLTDFLP